MPLPDRCIALNEKHIMEKKIIQKYLHWKIVEVMQIIISLMMYKTLGSSKNYQKLSHHKT